MCLVTQLFPTLCDPMNSSSPGSSIQRDSPGKNNGVGCHALHQGIFLTQRSNSSFPHCRWIFYFLSHQGSPVLQISSNKLLEWLSHFTFLTEIYDSTSISKFLPAFIIFFLIMIIFVFFLSLHSGNSRGAGVYP